MYYCMIVVLNFSISHCFDYQYNPANKLPCIVFITLSSLYLFLCRWMTTANGYVRLILFKLTLTEHQKQNCLTILKWVVNVYCPNFLLVHLRPRGPDGPRNILHLRDYILAFQQEDEEMVAMIKPYFMRHAVTWVGGQNLAINAFSNDAPFSVQDLLNDRQRLPRSIPTEEYLWQPRSIREFYVRRTKDAWCLRSATPSFWRSIDNHNRTCERYNGYLGKIFERKTINDFETEEDRPTVDRRFRGFMINLGKKLGPNRS